MNKFLILISFSFCIQDAVLAQDSLDWLIVYYAPYDNNLSSYSDSILKQLESAKEYENVQVVLQVDKADSEGMYRYTITSNGTIIDTIPSEESTSGKILNSYLRWASRNFSFKHSALFFLDHGGGLNEVGQDLQPDSSFLTTTSIQKAMKKFNRWSSSTVDLLYLQVCAKSSIEPLYEFRDVSNYTLASQQLLGAPNYYYPKTIQFLSQHPNSSGAELAKSIATNDRTDMIESLTCIDNNQFSLIRSNFRKLVIELEKRPQITFSAAPLHFDYSTDRYWDLISFLESLNLQTPEELAAKDALIQSIQKELIEYQLFSDPNSAYSGISIATISKDRIRAYWKMKFYRDFLIHKIPVE